MAARPVLQPLDGNPNPPFHTRYGLRPLLAVVLRAVAERLEDNPESPIAIQTHLDIELAIRLLEDAALAPNTRKAYAGALRRYGAWLGGRLPTDRAFAAYLDEMFSRGLAYPNAVLADAAVRRAVRDLARDGHHCTVDPVGQLTLERLERFHREASERGRGQVAPLLWEDADRMSECAEKDGDLWGIRDAALIGLGCDALLRISEVSGLVVPDLSFERNGSALLRIRRSKTDQHGRGAVLFVREETAERLVRWMEAAGIDSGPLFRPVAARGVRAVRLGPDAVRAVIKRRAKKAGITGRISGHSLRVGAAQSLAERGATLVELQVERRWECPEMAGHYVRNQEAARGAVARLRGRK